MVRLRVPSNGVVNASLGGRERRYLTFDGPACSGSSPVGGSSICL